MFNKKLKEEVSQLTNKNAELQKELRENYQEYKKELKENQLEIMLDMLSKDLKNELNFIGSELYVGKSKVATNSIYDTLFMTYHYGYSRRDELEAKIDILKKVTHQQLKEADKRATKIDEIEGEAQLKVNWFNCNIEGNIQTKKVGRPRKSVK